jgi:hypothetical protein
MMKESSDSQPLARFFSSTLSAPFSSVTQTSLFEMAPISDCSELLGTASQLASFDPEILVCIERDLDTHALEKKRKRWEHQRWIEEQSDALIDLPEPDVDGIKLSAGRPRMHPLAVFAFLLLRGWLGGARDSRFELILRESISLQIFLHNLGQSMPGASTIEENLNALGNETRERIHKAQLSLALTEGLDDFESLRIDSTHCASASAYPTDSGTLTKLVCRLCSMAGNLARIGLPALIESESSLIEALAEEIRKLNYRIGTLTSSSAIQTEKSERQQQQQTGGHETATGGDGLEGGGAQTPEKQVVSPKKKSAKTKLRRELYEELYGKSQSALGMLAPIVNTIRELITAEADTSSPQAREQREQWQSIIETDVQAVLAVIEQSRRRVCEGKKPSAKTKMPLSVSDPSASFIEKGGWERVFGYRPQCGFSAGGLVTVLLVPEGNQSDQSQLSQAVNESIANTGVTPSVVTVDDGYTGESEWIKVQEVGVEVVSFSGARGKALLGEERWDDQRYVQARRDRNGAESGISVLKDKVRFGQLSCVGIEAVRREQLEKVLAVNALKLVALRKRKYEKETSATWLEGLPGKRGRKVA